MADFLDDNSQLRDFSRTVNHGYMNNNYTPREDKTDNYYNYKTYSSHEPDQQSRMWIKQHHGDYAFQRSASSIPASASRRRDDNYVYYNNSYDDNKKHYYKHDDYGPPADPGYRYAGFNNLVFPCK